MEAVAARPEVAALELNVSCPNVKSGCVMGSERGEMAALMDAVRPLTAKPLIVKLTPNVGDVGAGRDGRRGRRGRRALADQHAARAWRSTRAPGGRGWARAGAACPVRRSGRWRSR